MRIILLTLAAILVATVRSSAASDNLRALREARSHRNEVVGLFRELVQIAKDEEDLETFMTILASRWALLRKIAQTEPVTIFAPTDDAFENISLTPFRYHYNADILDDLLKYHVLEDAYTAADFVEEGERKYETLNGEEVTVIPSGQTVLIQSAAGQAEVIEADIDLSDGSIVHLIDNVLIPPNFPSADFAVLAKQGGLTELLNALEIAGLTSYATSLTVKGLTLFAPENAAFEKAAEENDIQRESGEEFFSDALQRALGADAFEDILKNHLARSLLDSKSLETKAAYRCSKWYLFHWWCAYFEKVTAISGAKLKFRKEDDGDLLIRFGENFSKTSKIIDADLRTLTGIAHVIDTIIIP